MHVFGHKIQFFHWSGDRFRLWPYFYVCRKGDHTPWMEGTWWSFQFGELEVRVFVTEKRRKRRWEEYLRDNNNFGLVHNHAMARLKKVIDG